MIEAKRKMETAFFRELWMQSIDIEDSENMSAEAQLIEIAAKEKMAIVLIAYEQVPNLCTYLYRIGKKIYCVKKYGDE